MAERRRRIDKVLDPAFLTDLPSWTLDELRRHHAECMEIETEVSYVRRVSQARIDILEAKLDRRALITDGTLATVPSLGDDELRSTIGQLGQLEQEASRQRRALHRVIDRIEADLAARHKVGQA
jgi:hypothetical protein